MRRFLLDPLIDVSSSLTTNSRSGSRSGCCGRIGWHFGRWGRGIVCGCCRIWIGRRCRCSGTSAGLTSVASIVLTGTRIADIPETATVAGPSPATACFNIATQSNSDRSQQQWYRDKQARHEWTSFLSEHRPWTIASNKPACHFLEEHSSQRLSSFRCASSFAIPYFTATLPAS